MRVLVVAANQEQEPEPVVPLGAAYVAAAARDAGHDVRLHDACFDGAHAPERAARAAASWAPDVIGVSIRNCDDVAWPRSRSFVTGIEKLVGAVRGAVPTTRLVLGGSGFSLFPELFLDRLGADHGVVGEGEGTFVELLDAIGRRDRPPRLLSGSAPSPLAGPPPAIDLVDVARYAQEGGCAAVQTKRGCAMGCAYCTYPLLEGAAWRRRDPEVVVDELERAWIDRGVTHAFIVDNVFNIPRAHAIAVCAAMERRRLPLRWTAFVSPHGASSAMLGAMRRAGCEGVELGTDAAHPDTLEGLSKPFGVDEIVAASAACHDAGVPFCHALVLGGPGETSRTLAQTVEIVEATRPAAVVAMLGVRIYPGTPLARRAVREGLLASEASLGLAPEFYVSPAVRETLVARAREIAARLPHWIFPALEGDEARATCASLRRRGRRAPLWTLARRRLARPRR